MTPILASTSSTIFQQYDFDFDPCATLLTEFRRLARFRKWKQGSNSKMFKKAWDQCFGLEVPVGYKLDRRESLVGAQYDMDSKAKDGGFVEQLMTGYTGHIGLLRLIPS
ncbi:MAG: hypothetical protein FRX48_02169 [Lasallia pustulata]|uniref:Uncharacterized protein n=1 Tax=Lasallia pustulata TaxID=136370 RepID=A0A5M8PW03_9LECA|nr:MAG: hypothetical protein FRX48_02169 [Lasallia pustulata]